MPTITPEKRQMVINLYINDHKTLREIEKISGVCRPTVRKILRKAGARSVFKEEIDHSSSVNTSFFDKINSEEKAYFLGFMYADGNVYLKSKTKNYNAVSLCLQEKDKEIIIKFQKLIAPQHKIYMVKKKPPEQNQYKLMFQNKQICEQLIALGCVPNKSLMLDFPHNMADDLLNHFVRGYFDGDGCISSRKIKLNYLTYQISITSSAKFCKTLTNILNYNLGIKPTLRLRNNGITTELCFGGNRQVQKFMEWLYKDATIYLSRKHHKFEQLLIQNSKYKKPRL